MKNYSGIKYQPPLAPPKEWNENPRKKRYLIIAETNSPPMEGLGVVYYVSP